MYTQLLNFSFLPYLFLYFTIVSMWFSKRHITQGLMIVSISLGLLSNQITWIAMIPIVFLPIAIFYTQIKDNNIFLLIFSNMIILSICVGLLANFFPAFKNYIVLSQVLISKDAIPFTLSLNFGYAIVGIFLLSMGDSLIQSFVEWINLLKKIKWQIIILNSVVIGFAIFLGLVRFDLKIADSLFIWSITNLLFVSTGEEEFFRGFVQKKISQCLKNIPYGNSFAIIFSSILFGIAHFPGGIKYIFLATVAGIGYGIIYDRSKRIEASIIAHFSVNLIHFTLFTYPVLAYSFK